MSKGYSQTDKYSKRALRLTRRAEKYASRARLRHQWKTLPKSQRPKQFSNAFLHRWNVQEEIANSLTHAIGVLLGVTALVLLVVDASLHRSAVGIVAGAIFGTSLILAYVSSTIYHLIFYPPLKQVFKILDHSCIFLLIAGTYTPFCLITLHGVLGWALFGVVWGLAVIGIILKIIFGDQYELLSTFIYLGMGWISVTVVGQLLQDLPLIANLWLLAGGVAYTFGVIFFLLERIPFFHTIWHIFVLAGSICHFFAILLYVMPVKV